MEHEVNIYNRYWKSKIILTHIFKKKTRYTFTTHLCGANLRSILWYNRFAGLFAPRTLDRLPVYVRIVDGHYSVGCWLFGGESTTKRDTSV